MADADMPGAYRADGRTPDQSRATTCRLGVLSRAQGSAQLEVEDTVVLAAVHGPLMVGGRRETPSCATIEIVYKPFNGRSGPQERHWESLIHKLVMGAVVLEQYPRSCIQVVLQVCRQGGSELPVLLNAAIAALLDAAVSMRAVYASAAVAELDGRLLVDPEAAEEREALYAMTATYKFRRRDPAEKPDEIDASLPVLCDACGTMPMHKYAEAVQTCQSASRQAVQLLYRAVQEKVAPG